MLPPDPITPADCDLRDFAFMPMDCVRLFSSEFHAVSSDTEWRAGVTLWMKAWHQVPAGSLPDDDVQLARLAELGRDVRGWRKMREAALRGWVKASDGRLYHPVVAEKALEAWLEKLAQRISSGAGNAKRWGGEFDQSAIEAEIDRAAAMLTAIAPHSKAIAKAKRRHSRSSPNGKPTGNAPGVPLGSQGTGTGIYTLDKSNGADAPPDPNSDKQFWDGAKAYLGANRASLIGKWVKAHGKDETARAITAAQIERAVDPVPYIEKILRGGEKQWGGLSVPC